MVYDSLRIELEIDKDNQWFAFIWVELGNRKALVRFKIDTGCNSLVISHKTLSALGYDSSLDSLAKLPAIHGRLASGDKHPFGKLGKASLSILQGSRIQICKADAVCHTTHETHDLLGTEVFKQFRGVSFNLIDEKYMELIKA